MVNTPKGLARPKGPPSREEASAEDGGRESVNAYVPSPVSQGCTLLGLGTWASVPQETLQACPLGHQVCERASESWNGTRPHTVCSPKQVVLWVCLETSPHPLHHAATPCSRHSIPQPLTLYLPRDGPAHGTGLGHESQTLKMSPLSPNRTLAAMGSLGLIGSS